MKPQKTDLHASMRLLMSILSITIHNELKRGKKLQFQMCVWTLGGCTITRLKKMLILAFEVNSALSCQKLDFFLGL